MKFMPIIKTNLKKKMFSKPLELSINGITVWNSKKRKIMKIESSEFYDIEIKSKDNIYKNSRSDSLENKQIYIYSRKPSKWFGLRGILAYQIMKFFKKEYSFKIKKLENIDISK